MSLTNTSGGKRIYSLSSIYLYAGRIVIFGILLLSIVFTGYSQVLVGSSQGIPDPSAALEVRSTSQGLLVPRLTEAQIDSIHNPAAGLLLFNVDHNSLMIYTGTSWIILAEGLCAPPPSQAAAGSDFSVQNDSASLGATDPEFGHGYWQVLSGNGGTFNDSTQASAILYGYEGQTYLLRWTVYNLCDSTSDDVEVSLDCPSGFEDCDANYLNECETNVMNDVNNCGVCGNFCSGLYAVLNAACSGGNCVIVSCIPGYDDCDGYPGNGCEEELSNNIYHCGSCYNACPPGYVCNNGNCTPP